MALVIDSTATVLPWWAWVARTMCPLYNFQRSMLSLSQTLSLLLGSRRTLAWLHLMTTWSLTSGVGGELSLATLVLEFLISQVGCAHKSDCTPFLKSPSREIYSDLSVPSSCHENSVYSAGWGNYFSLSYFPLLLLAFPSSMTLTLVRILSGKVLGFCWGTSESSFWLICAFQRKGDPNFSISSPCRQE